MSEENTWGWQLTVKVTDLGTLTDLIKSDQVSVVGDIKNLNAPQPPAPRPAPTQKLSKFAAPRGPAGNYPYGSRTQEAADKKQAIIDALRRYDGQTTFSELSIAYGNARYDRNGFQGVLEALVKGGYVEKVSKGWYRLIVKDAPDNGNDGGDEGVGDVG